MKHFTYVLILALTLTGCGPKTKPVLVKFDASCLTAIQVIAATERDLTTAGLLTPAQALEIRLKLRPVIEYGAKATDSLIAWQTGQPVPASLWQLSKALTDLTTFVVAYLPNGGTKDKILSSVAVAQAAWGVVIQAIELGQEPTPTGELAGCGA